MLGMLLAALDQTIVATALPDHRRRPGRAEPPVLGRDRLPGRLDRDHAALRQDQRPLRPQARVPVRDRRLPDRLGAGRPVAEHDRADRVPRPAGRRRRRADDARDDDHRRRRPAARARPLPGLHGRRVRARERDRPAPRRLLRRPALVAVGLLRQPARRRGGARRHEHRARPALHGASSHRIDYLGTALLVGAVGSILLAVTWGGTQYAWGSAIITHPGRRRRVLLAAFVTVERRAAEPVLPLYLFRNRVFSGRDGDDVHRRPGDVRRHHLPAAVPAGRRRPAAPPAPACCCCR